MDSKSNKPRTRRRRQPQNKRRGRRDTAVKLVARQTQPELYSIISRYNNSLSWSSKHVAQTQAVKLHYGELIILNNSLGNTVDKEISVNNWYDLDPSVGGHQPMYYDFWSSLYRRFIPVGAKLTVRFTNPLNAAATAYILPALSETYSFSDINQIIEHPYVKLATLEPVSGKSSKTISFELDFPTWYQLLTTGNGTSMYSVYELMNRRNAVNTHILSSQELFCTFGAFSDSAATGVQVQCVVDLEVRGFFTDPDTQGYSVKDKKLQDHTSSKDVQKVIKEERANLRGKETMTCRSRSAKDS